MLATSAALLGCGGGGDAAGDANDTTGNPFVSKVGTYASGCTKTSYPGGTPSSTNVTLVLSAPTGSSKVAANYHDQEYIGSDTCDAASLDTDITVSGTLTALSGTKVIDIIKAIGGGNTITGTASTAAFRLESLTLSKGSITLPAMGTVANVGYLFQGSKLYALINPKGESDQLGAYFSSVFMTKQ